MRICGCRVTFQLCTDRDISTLLQQRERAVKSTCKFPCAAGAAGKTARCSTHLATRANFGDPCQFPADVAP
jgi:hypothetical protein